MGTASPAEVFQISLTIERHWVKEVIRAIFGTILFHRVLGNTKPSTFEVCGVTFPVPAAPEAEASISNLVDKFSRAFLGSSPGISQAPTRIYISLYSTSQVPRRVSEDANAAKPRPLAPAVTSALGWFSASAKVFANGFDDETDVRIETEQDCGKMWEGWVIDIDPIAEGRIGTGEEKLRSQLNDFLMRSTIFAMNKTNHVPPITSSGLQPFGIQTLINPTTAPFVIPKATLTTLVPFTVLHKSLLNTGKRGITSRSESFRDGLAVGYSR